MKQAVNAPKAPKPQGPYSAGIVAKGRFLFVAGQVPADPATGQVIQGTFKEQVVRTLENVKAVVEGAGATMADVVRVGVYLKDMGNFAEMNEIYATYFPDPKPARTTVPADFPRFPIEIDVIAVLPD